jgi:hypothetical protein
MLEAYQKAYQAELDFDKKVSDYKTGVMTTALATSELFKPLI